MPFDQSQDARTVKTGSAHLVGSPTSATNERVLLAVPADWPANTPAVLIAVANPAHACCDDHFAEVGDRWDGLS